MYLCIDNERTINNKSLTMNFESVIIHSQSKREKIMILTKDTTSTEQEKVLDNIIENAIGLPLDNQEVLLLVAKSMRYTRECMMSKGDVE